MAFHRLPEAPVPDFEEEEGYRDSPVPLVQRPSSPEPVPFTVPLPTAPLPNPVTEAAPAPPPMGRPGTFPTPPAPSLGPMQNPVMEMAPVPTPPGRPPSILSAPTSPLAGWTLQVGLSVAEQLPTQSRPGTPAGSPSKGV